MNGVWDFIQNQILGMHWLNDLIGSLLTVCGLDPVSYTHLDVYKRQIMYREEYTAKFFDSWFRRLRKYGAGGEALCQTVSSLLASEYGRDSLSNSEFVIMFNQSASDRKQLAELLDISDAQLAYITNAESGTGLLRRSSVIVPFNGTFDRNTKLYKAMTTKIEEVALIG